MKFKLQLCVCVRASTHAGGGSGAGSDTSATWFTPQDIWQNWAIWLCMPGFPATRSCGPVQEATAQGGDEIGFWFYSRTVTEWNWSCDRKKHLLLTKLNWGWVYLMISSQSPYIHFLWGKAKQNQWNITDITDNICCLPALLAFPLDSLFIPCLWYCWISLQTSMFDHSAESKQFVFPKV